VWIRVEPASFFYWCNCLSLGYQIVLQARNLNAYPHARKRIKTCLPSPPLSKLLVSSMDLLLFHNKKIFIIENNKCAWRVETLFARWERGCSKGGKVRPFRRALVVDWADTNPGTRPSLRFKYAARSINLIPSE
jgi:hypothetical protein